ncbi:hypothetical protein PR048_021955 [Dryococelus australis]|uniref:Uncharacterized protein n=1 Tax=Dryococelus australis TaxID=614101 RepID=A0ABQ9GZN8_9NEOP|nr:hypothetical protein PR048_021955 [Dryococelus australis]
MDYSGSIEGLETAPPADDSPLIPIQHVCMLLYTTNFGINFVLYCVSGQNFRRALQSLCCPRRRNTDTPPATTGKPPPCLLRMSSLTGSRPRP